MSSRGGFVARFLWNSFRDLGGTQGWLPVDAVDGDEEDPAGGAVEGEARAGSFVGGRLGDDDGPVFDAGVGEGLFDEALGVVEAGADLRVDLFDEAFLDLDDAAGGI